MSPGRLTVNLCHTNIHIPLVIQTLMPSPAGFNQQLWCMSSPKQSAEGRKGRGWGEAQNISITDQTTCEPRQDLHLTLSHKTLKVSLDTVISHKHLVNSQFHGHFYLTQQRKISKLMANHECESKVTFASAAWSACATYAVPILASL